MQYLGGKSRHARHIVEAILADGGPTNRVVEPFCGACNVTCAFAKLLPHAEITANDANPAMCALWEAMQGGLGTPGRSQ